MAAATETCAGNAPAGKPLERLRDAFERLRELKETLDKEAKIIMEPMIPEGAELFIGYQRHPQFGPVISLGLGGVFLELTKDVTFRLLPARQVDFSEMFLELRSWPKLKKGFMPIGQHGLETLILLMFRRNNSHQKNILRRECIMLILLIPTAQQWI